MAPGPGRAKNQDSLARHDRTSELRGEASQVEASHPVPTPGRVVAVTLPRGRRRPGSAFDSHVATVATDRAGNLESVHVATYYDCAAGRTTAAAVTHRGISS